MLLSTSRRQPEISGGRNTLERDSHGFLIHSIRLVHQPDITSRLMQHKQPFNRSLILKKNLHASQNVQSPVTVRKQQPADVSSLAGHAAAPLIAATTNTEARAAAPLTTTTSTTLAAATATATPAATAGAPAAAATAAAATPTATPAAALPAATDAAPAATPDAATPAVAAQTEIPVPTPPPVAPSTQQDEFGTASMQSQLGLTFQPYQGHSTCMSVPIDPLFGENERPRRVGPMKQPAHPTCLPLPAIKHTRVEVRLPVPPGHVRSSQQYTAVEAAAQLMNNLMGQLSDEQAGLFVLAAAHPKLIPISNGAPVFASPPTSPATAAPATTAAGATAAAAAATTATAAAGAGLAAATPAVTTTTVRTTTPDQLISLTYGVPTAFVRALGHLVDVDTATLPLGEYYPGEFAELLLEGTPVRVMRVHSRWVGQDNVRPLPCFDHRDIANQVEQAGAKVLFARQVMLAPGVVAATSWVVAAAFDGPMLREGLRIPVEGGGTVLLYFRPAGLPPRWQRQQDAARRQAERKRGWEQQSTEYGNANAGNCGGSNADGGTPGGGASGGGNNRNSRGRSGDDTVGMAGTAHAACTAPAVDQTGASLGINGNARGRVAGQKPQVPSVVQAAPQPTAAEPAQPAAKRHSIEVEATTTMTEGQLTATAAATTTTITTLTVAAADHPTPTPAATPPAPPRESPTLLVPSPPGMASAALAADLLTEEIVEAPSVVVGVEAEMNVMEATATASAACVSGGGSVTHAALPVHAAPLGTSSRILRPRHASHKASKSAATTKRSAIRASKPARHSGGEDSDAPRPEIPVGRFQALLDDDEEYGVGADNDGGVGGMTT